MVQMRNLDKAFEEIKAVISFLKENKKEILDNHGLEISSVVIEHDTIYFETNYKVGQNTGGSFSLMKILAEKFELFEVEDGMLVLLLTF